MAFLSAAMPTGDDSHAASSNNSTTATEDPLSDIPTESPPLLCVPPPVLTTILSHLPANDLARVLPTCRSLYHLAVQDSLWQPLHDQLAPPPSSSSSSTATSKHQEQPAVAAGRVVPFIRRYREKLRVVQREQREAKELQDLRDRLMAQKKPFVDCLTKWVFFVVEPAFLRRLYVDFCIGASLIMLCARLLVFSTLPMAAVLAPLYLLALASGVGLAITAVLFFFTFWYPHDQARPLRIGRVVLARKNMEFSLSCLGIAGSFLSASAFLFFMALYMDYGSSADDVVGVCVQRYAKMAFCLIGMLPYAVAVLHIVTHMFWQDSKWPHCEGNVWYMCNAYGIIAFVAVVIGALPLKWYMHGHEELHVKALSVGTLLFPAYGGLHWKVFNANSEGLTVSVQQTMRSLAFLLFEFFMPCFMLFDYSPLKDMFMYFHSD